LREAACYVRDDQEQRVLGSSRICKNLMGVVADFDFVKHTVSYDDEFIL